MRQCGVKPIVVGTPLQFADERCAEIADSMLPEPMRKKNYGNDCERTTHLLMRIAWKNCEPQFGEQESAAKGTDARTKANLRAFSGNHWTDIGWDNSTYPWLNSCGGQPQLDGEVLDGTSEANHGAIAEDDLVFYRAIGLMRRGWEARPSYACPTSAVVAPSGAKSSGTTAGQNGEFSSTTEETTPASAYRLVNHRTATIDAASSSTIPQVLLGGEDTRISVSGAQSVSLALKSPDGTVITPTSLPDGVTYEQSGDTAEQRVSTFTIAAAKAGTWEMTVTNADAAPATVYALSVETNSTVGLITSTNALSYSLSAPVTVRAALVGGEGAVTSNVSVTAMVDETGEQYTLRDDGTGGDTKAGDGEFAAQLPGFASDGYKTVNLFATWPGGERQGSVTPVIVDRLAQITSVGPNGTPIEQDNDGRWQGLTFPVEINAEQVGTLTLSGRLVASDGTTVANTNQLVDLVIGSQTVNLQFAGTQIHDAQQTGTYKITGVALEGTLGDTMTYDSFATSVTSAQSYHWADFAGEPLRLVVTGSSGIRPDADSPYTRLVVDAKLSVDAPGVYAWTGDLFTADGRRVAGSEPVSMLVTGTQAIQFGFRGGDILASGLDDPYELRNVAVWRVSTDLVRYFGTTDAAHITQTYTASQFANIRPTITSLSPGMAPAGGPAFTLTVNGTNYIADSVVRWNGSDRPTSFVSATQLTAEIGATDIAAVGTASITVVTPGPDGGTSSEKTFTIADTTPPDITITSSPSGWVRSTAASFAFASTESGATFKCLLDTGTEGVCTSPKSYTGLAEGAHTFKVKAVDRAGNVGTWVSSSWSVDTVSPAGSVLVNAGAAYARSTSVTLKLSAADAGSGVTAMRLRNSNTTTWSAPRAYATSASWTLPTGNGPKTVYVQYQDRAGNWSVAYGDSIYLDTTLPVTGAPVQSFVPNTQLGVSTLPVRIAWSGSDTGSGIAKYQVQQRSYGSTAWGAWSWVTSGTTVRTLDRQLAPGRYQFQVRAMDKAGNWSAWKAGAAFTVTAYQETSTATAGKVAYGGTWSRQYQSSAYGTYTKYAAVKGSYATFSFTGGKQVAWVAPRVTNGGYADVYLDGVKVATVNLYASSAQYRKVVYAKVGLNPSVLHTLKVYVTGTKASVSSGTRVDIDGFVVLR